MERSRVTDHDGYVVTPGSQGAGSRARHPTLRLQPSPDAETDDGAWRGPTDAYETVERPVRAGSNQRGNADYLVPVTGGQRVYATVTAEDSLPGPLDSAVVSNPTFRSDAGGGDGTRSREQAASMSARLSRMKQKQATDRWRMLNTLLSVVAIAIAVVAMLQKTDTPAAPESPRPTAVVSAEQQVQDNVDRDATILTLSHTLNASVRSSLH